ncbi:zinc finger domain-containing protein [Mycobacteroides abscessus]|nr:hypothetical protein [Mycobacteroides abscessus]QSM04881.1 hypothetical protein PROPHIGD91-4_30 [Mycobacterium phage prophi91-4]MDO3335130.1 hypothetical protein [Mycobacteroides abscessus subsp. bolletii]SIB01075.1 Uncharacterised protein [Mycobacteroides abscessus subsp. bolletii]SII69989.1 Uncharacterised protein [Mycobacteroides abscessus subsp. bolletii]SKS57263.1 Uncharacterised protein [Mycobacteroides abscessus subsp. bolletii]
MSALESERCDPDASTQARTRERLGELSEAAGASPREFSRPSMNPSQQRPERAVRCPHPACRAQPGKPCWNSATKTERKDFHPARTNAAYAQSKVEPE